MKQIFFYIPIFFLGLAIESPISFRQKKQKDEAKFKLRFATIGFGSNMWDMQPIFNVEGTEFVYTSEEVWVAPDQKKIERDTLLKGNFRKSSVDSISNLISKISDSVIKNSNPRIMSGSAASIEISTPSKKITFDLHNASDTTAEKIVAILNTYIPKGYNQLFISNFKKR